MLALIPALAFGVESEVKLDRAPIDPANLVSLQRGAHTFVNYCLNCHSASYMRYNRLQDIGLSEPQIRDNLVFTGVKVGELMKTAMDPRSSVENAITLTGVNRKPMPTPCNMPVHTNVLMLTSVVNSDISHNDSAEIDRPVNNNRRASTEFTRRPTMNIDTIVPSPRGAST